jgi:hypothetical protein
MEEFPYRDIVTMTMWQSYLRRHLQINAASGVNNTD